METELKCVQTAFESSKKSEELLREEFSRFQSHVVSEKQRLLSKIEELSQQNMQLLQRDGINPVVYHRAARSPSSEMFSPSRFNGASSAQNSKYQSPSMNRNFNKRISASEIDMNNVSIEELTSFMSPNPINRHSTISQPGAPTTFPRNSSIAPGEEYINIFSQYIFLFSIIQC